MGRLSTQAVMEKLQLGVAASASATCDCNHETLVEHMEVRVTKATGRRTLEQGAAAYSADL